MSELEVSLRNDTARCPHCGQPLRDETRVCASCGEPVAALGESERTTTAVPVVRRTAIYAGFWLRAVAYVLDSLLIAMVATFVIFIPLIERGAIPAGDPWTWFATVNRQTTAVRLLIFMMSWLYFALFESSVWQATPAKRAFQLKVTDLEGRRISFTRASYRYLGKLAFGTLLLFGFLFAAFTPRKQALHDILAKCLVLKRPRQA